MHDVQRSLLLGALSALVVSAAPAYAQQVERFTLGEGPVAIYNLVGEVEVVAGSGGDVIVDVARGGADGSALRVEVADRGRSRTLSVVYPEDRIAYPRMPGRSRTTMRVRGDGTFGGWGGDRVTITRDRGMEAYADLRIMVPEGRRVAVNLGVGRASARDLTTDELALDLGSGAVDAEGIRAQLTIDTGSGSVRVRSVQGRTYLDTGSGRIEATDVRGAELRIDTGSGSVEVQDVDVDELEVDSGSGSIRLHGAAPRIRMDTGSGSITAELLADVEDLVVDTGSGSVTLYVPDDIGAEIELETGSGGMEMDLPLMLTRKERDYLRGRLGDGRGSIRIDTGSGSIHIRRR